MKRRVLAAPAILAALLGGGTALATPFKPRPVIRVDWITIATPPKIRLFVTDLDEEGRARPPSTPAQYQLLVNGLPENTPPKVDTAGNADEPMDLTLVVQVGPAMKPVLPAVKESLGEIVARASQSSKIRVIAYADGIVADTSAPTPAEARAAVEALAIKEDALEMMLSEAVQTGLNTAAAAEGAARKMMVVVSDGTSREVNQQTFSELGRFAFERSVRVHTVGFAAIDEAPLRATLSVLSKRSRGTERESTTPEKLKDALRALADELRNQRILEYDLPRVFTGLQYDFQVLAGDVASEPVNLMLPKQEFAKPSPLVPILIAFGGFVFLGLGVYLVLAAKKKKQAAARAMLEQLQQQPAAAPTRDFGETIPGLRPSATSKADVPAVARPPPKEVVITPSPASFSVPGSSPSTSGSAFRSPSPAPAYTPPAPAYNPPAPAYNPPAPRLPDPDAHMASFAGAAPAFSPPSDLAATLEPSPAPLPDVGAGGFRLPRPTEFLQRAQLGAAGLVPETPAPAPRAQPATRIARDEIVVPRPLTPPPGSLDPATDPHPPRIQLPNLEKLQAPRQENGNGAPRVTPAPPPAPAPVATTQNRFVQRKTMVISEDELGQVDVSGWIVPLDDSGDTLVLKSGFRVGVKGGDYLVPPAPGRPSDARLELDNDGRWVMVAATGRRALADGDIFSVGAKSFLFKFATRFGPDVEEKTPYLHIVGGPDDGRHIPLADGQAKVIGAHPSSAAVIRGAGVAGMHAVARLERNTCRVASLGAEEGLKANGQVVAEATLTQGQEVQLGSVRLVFRVPRSA